MEEEIKKAINVLRKGGVLLYPTDTIWGIGCDATNSKAVKRIYEIKRRCEGKAMLALVGRMSDVEQWVDDVPEMAFTLNEMSEKPVTIIYDHGIGVAPELLGDDGSIGIRVSREPFTQQLCNRLGHPLVSTSANIAGEPSPSFFHEISDEVKNAVDYIVNYRQADTTPHMPSSVIRLSSSNVIKIIRP
ncbi:MAG: L-threonylcarbamoyladenylate synthase [Candidatus Limisoma sp.]|nr:threonylcarbamoyl-AMP synthase [Muribaculaceae bacterium]MDD6868095.1 L-threonylcarbamoyladenylate synthase [bacterium]MDY5826539.1 L-threonylcarbamoyladenylate synthase [Candidatus Limisoma sp.]